MSWLKSKALWVNIVAILIVAIEYMINNNALPAYAVWEGLALAVFDAIYAAINTVQTLKLKAQVAELKKLLKK